MFNSPLEMKRERERWRGRAKTLLLKEFGVELINDSSLQMHHNLTEVDTEDELSKTLRNPFLHFAQTNSGFTTAQQSTFVDALWLTRLGLDIPHSFTTNMVNDSKRAVDSFLELVETRMLLICKVASMVEIEMDNQLKTLAKRALESPCLEFVLEEGTDEQIVVAITQNSKIYLSACSRFLTTLDEKGERTALNVAFGISTQNEEEEEEEEEEEKENEFREAMEDERFCLESDNYQFTNDLLTNNRTIIAKRLKAIEERRKRNARG